MFYYLCCIINPQAVLGQNDLPKNANNSSSPPEVIVRQDGNSGFVYFVKDQIAHRFDKFSSSLIQSSMFNPETTEYWFEPGNTKNIEPEWPGCEMPILATVSPNKDRYKEFKKNGATTIYMPIFTLEELQLIGQHMLVHGNIPDKLIPYYSHAFIQDQYEEYGGIIRHVLISNLSGMLEIKEEKRDALQACSVSAIYSSSQLSSTVSHYIAKYEVSRNNFINHSLSFVNDRIVEKLNKKFALLEFKDLVEILLDYQDASSSEQDNLNIGKVFERMILYRLKRGFEWTVQEVSVGSKGKVV
jgi:hypothetical protein